MMEVTKLDKKTLNNFVVSMRNVVKRAKVHTINSMARKSKMLKAKKGTEEKVAQNNIKADRLVKEIMELKKLEVDAVSKFALTTTQNLSKLQGNPLAPISIRVIARLCSHSFITSKCKEFKEKYKINQKEILQIFNKKKSKKKALKISVTSNNNLNECSGIESDINEVKLSEKNNCSEEGEEEEEEEEEEEKEEEEDIESNSESDSDQNSEIDDVSSQNKKLIISATSHKKETLMYDKKSNPENEGSHINRRDKIIKKVKSNNVKDIKTEHEIQSENILDKVKVVDPFFITKENENYITNQVPMSEKNAIFEKNKKEMFKKEILDSYSTERTSIEQLENRFNTSSEFKNRKERRSGLSKTTKLYKPTVNSRSFFDYKRKDKFQNNYPKMMKTSNIYEKVLPNNSNFTAKDNNKNLHPSWEAKKKINSIVEYQGKKIKFDD